MEDIETRLRASAGQLEGTPFRRLHQQPGVGIDCANVSHFLFTDLSISLPDLGAPTFGITVGDHFEKATERYLAQLVEDGIFEQLDDCAAPDIQGLDLLLYRINKRQSHMTTAISAAEQVSVWPGRTVEIIAIDAAWRRRLVGHYRFINRDS